MPETSASSSRALCGIGGGGVAERAEELNIEGAHSPGQMTQGPGESTVTKTLASSK